MDKGKWNAHCSTLQPAFDKISSRKGLSKSKLKPGYKNKPNKLNTTKQKRWKNGKKKEPERNKNSTPSNRMR